MADFMMICRVESCTSIVSALRDISRVVKVEQSQYSLSAVPHSNAEIHLLYLLALSGSLSTWGDWQPSLVVCRERQKGESSETPSAGITCTSWE